MPTLIYNDPERVRQVIVNLLSNAIRFTEKGYIRFEIHYIKEEKRSAVEIIITDTGIGIATEQ